jgi:hypothetical protein
VALTFAEVGLMHLSNHVKILDVIDAVAAGSTDKVGDHYVDMQGYDGVIFIAHIGTLTSGQVTTLEAKGSDTTSGFAAFATPAITAAMADGDGKKCLVLDIFQPGHRYVQPTIHRATQNAVIDSCIAILYQADYKPVSNVADSVNISQIAKFVSP